MSPRLIYLLSVFCRLETPMSHRDVHDAFQAIQAVDRSGRAFDAIGRRYMLPPPRN